MAEVESRKFAIKTLVYCVFTTLFMFIIGLASSQFSLGGVYSSQFILWFSPFIAVGVVAAGIVLRGDDKRIIGLLVLYQFGVIALILGLFVFNLFSPSFLSASFGRIASLLAPVIMLLPTYFMARGWNAPGKIKAGATPEAAGQAGEASDVQQTVNVQQPVRRKNNTARTVATVIIILSGVMIGFVVGFVISFSACYKQTCSPVAESAMWIGMILSLAITIPLTNYISKK